MGIVFLSYDSGPIPSGKILRRCRIIELKVVSFLPLRQQSKVLCVLLTSKHQYGTGARAMTAACLNLNFQISSFVSSGDRDECVSVVCWRLP